MTMIKITTKNPQETMKFAARLGKLLKKGDIVCFFGDLGSGKTTFIKGLAQGMNIDQTKVNSPTFVLMNAYKGKLPLFHFDFYRLEGIGEINTIGYDEFIYGDGVAVIEWADRLKGNYPKEYLKVKLKHKKLNERVITMSAIGKKYAKVINKWG